MWPALVVAWQALATYDVQVADCALDAGELGRLTTLELRSAGAPSLSVSYACNGQDVSIGLHNSNTGISVQRLAVNVCCDDVETERTLAILASGLFKAAGHALGPRPEPSDDGTGNREGTTDSTGEQEPVDGADVHGADVHGADVHGGDVHGAATMPPPPPSETTPEPAATQRPPRSLPQETSAPAMLSSGSFSPDSIPTVADHQHVLGISGRVQAFNMNEPTLTYGVGIDYRFWAWRSIGFGGFANAAFSSSDRIGGEVMARVVSVGGVGSYRFARWPNVELATELAGGMSIVSIEGRAATTEFVSDNVTGATGNLELSFVPTVIFDRTQLSLPLGIGALFRAPRGSIGDEFDMETLQLDGVWLSGALRLSLGFANRQQGGTSPSEARQ